MAEEIAISLKNVSKCFKRYARPVDRLKELLLPGKSYAQEFWALRDINLDICKGETFGIIGQNGSGKSTLLQIIARTLTPTTGQVLVNGRVSALLELGSGFNPEFTGRQNVFFNGRILGLTQEEIENKFDDIAAFADIGDFIDQPVKTYSSGMFVRLAFAVAVNVEPEILIVDEALAVGDIFFQYKCMNEIKKLKDIGATILFVSHDNTAINILCKRSAWLLHGKSIEVGLSKEVINKYIAHLSIPTDHTNETPEAEIKNNEPSIESQENKLVKIVTNFQNTNQRMGNQKCQIIGACIFDNKNQPVKVLKPKEKFALRISVQGNEFIQNPLVGFNMADRIGNHIIETNTDHEGIHLPFCDQETVLTVEFKFEMPPLAAGYYSFSIDVNNGDESSHELCDWIVDAIIIEVIKNNKNYGLVDACTDVKFNIEERYLALKDRK